MKSLLPIIVVILVLTAAITFSLAKRTVPKREENRFGIAANQLDNTLGQTDPEKKSYFGYTQPTATPTPTVTPTVTPSATPTPSGNITPLPTTTEEDKDTTKGGKTAKSESKPKPSVTPRVIKTMVCTPVYGQANTCTEHIVVDTGAADSIFFNLAGLSYIAGLASFIKAKSLKK